ncbi:membrane hypothetical protein [Alphaproteobacteria bacterium]
MNTLFSEHVLWFVEVCFVILITIFALYFINRFIRRRLKKLAVSQNKSYWHESFLKSINRPIKLFIIMLGYGVVVEVISHQYKGYLSAPWVIWSLRVKSIGVVFAVTWMILNLIDKLESYLLKNQKISGGEFIDKAGVDILSKLLSIITLIISILAILHHIGIGAEAILAVGGVSSVIVALGSKDILANLFSTLMLYFDKPFVVGDKIKLLDKSSVVEGDVEKINWRFTKIRGNNKKVVFIPNTYLANATIENSTRLSYHSVVVVLKVAYGSLKLLKTLADSLKIALEGMPYEGLKYGITVEFIDVTESTIGIRTVLLFHKYVSKETLNMAKQEVILVICDFMHQHDIRFDARFE